MKELSKKPSNQWIKEIPESWEVKKLPWICFFQEGPGLRNWQFVEKGIPVVCVTNITVKGLNFSKHKRYISEEEFLDSYQHFTVENNDLLLASSGNSFGKVCSYNGEFDYQFILNTSTIRLHSLNEKIIKTSFIKRFIESDLFKNQIKILITGAAQPNFGPSHLNQIRIPLPFYKEQKLISHYLDKKIYQIDSLIEKIEKQIQLHEELKIALINQYISKGINLNVKMKDSGISLIGKIPNHWKIRRLTILGDFSKGKNITKSDLKESGLPVILYSHIYTKYDRNISVVDSYISKEKYSESTKIQSNTFLFTSSGETKDDIGKSLLYKGKDDISIGGDMVVYKFKESHLHDPDYYSFVFNSFICQSQKSSMSRGEIVVHIYERQLREIRVCVPPIDEQKKIKDCLIKIEENTKKLQENYQQKVQLLHEYRHSLLSSVLTGKIRITEDMI
tara:strand:+ start:596 stop:1939 length:1344 start_codon:yes stop_codon:yes gene_type:complete